MPTRLASQNPAVPPAVSAAIATSTSTAPPIVMPNATSSVRHHLRDSLTS